TVGGTADLWLAGMPAGSTASAHAPGGPAPDVAPAHSPRLVWGLPLTGGAGLTLDARGAAGYGPGAAPPSGPARPLSLRGYTHHLAGAENGIGDLNTRINALVGVFLDNARPDTTPAPDPLDFRPGGTVAGGFGYATLSPGLQQAFFIGDGRDGLGNVQQV